MSEEATNNELSHWFSTYGLITAERILGRYQITLPSTELVTALKTPTSFYHRLLKIPLINVLNGIVLQQANDYHIYAQKLFIDYLLSGESSKDEASQGAATRDDLEDERKKLVSLGEDYNHKQIQHDALITSSQGMLIKTTKEWRASVDKGITSLWAKLKKIDSTIKKSQIRRAIDHGLIHCDMSDAQSEADQFLFIDSMNEILKLVLTDELKQTMVNNLAEMLHIVVTLDDKIRPYVERAEDMSVQANAYRAQFYETIVRVIELIKLLPEYKIDPAQDAINREPLYFDKNIGAL